MTDYSNGKIYKIFTLEDPDYPVYVGSTVKPLHKRFTTHKCNYNLWIDDRYHYVSSFELFNMFGMDCCVIELIETFPCNSKNELDEREGEWIKKLDCVNHFIAGRTKEQYKNDKRIEKQEERVERRIMQKEKKKVIQQEYYENNKEKINEAKKQYRQENKEKIKEYKSIVIICPNCQAETKKDHLARHQKSTKCLNAFKLSD